MNTIPKVSVITPIYNVERYLPECLDSLAAQTLEDIEFVCVNDGSTDESLSILEAYADGDSRFVIVDQDNGGYGKAMNAGIAAAQGEYIGIVESDDFAEPDMFERLYAMASEHKCDLVKTNFFHQSVKNGTTYCDGLSGCVFEEVISPLEHPEVFDTTPTIWAALYRREFLADNGIDFLETPGASYQDTGFVMKSWLFARRVYLTRDAFLHYRVDNEGSSVKQPGKLFCVCDEFDSIERQLAQHPDVECVLAAPLTAKKYQTYLWNYQRVAMPYKYTFLERFRKEFAAARDAGRLVEDFYSEDDWKLVNEIIDSPDIVIGREVEEFERMQARAEATERAQQELSRVKKSSTWRAGRAVTAVPRAMKRKLGRNGR